MKDEIQSRHLAAHFKEERARTMVARAESNKELFENYAERFTETMRKSMADIGSDSVNKMLGQGKFASINDLEKAFKTVSDTTISEPLRQEAMRNIVSVSESLDDHIKLQRSALAQQKENKS